MAQASLVRDSAAPAVRVRDFVKRYGRRPVVDGLGLDVGAGQIYGLIGPDGAGKSSVLKAVAGVLTFDAGRVEVFGIPIDTARGAESVKARLGFMPQGLGLNLYPELSVEENVDFFARLRLVPPADLGARKERLLGITRLAAFRDRPMKNLSGGMKQKLALVCTLVHQPELVILDEPTTGVDPVARRDFWTILADLMAEQPMTALISTAYMDEASRFHRLAVMYGGRVLAEGEPDEVRTLVKGQVVVFETEAQATVLERLRTRFPQAETLGTRVRVLIPGAEPDAALEEVRNILGDAARAPATVGGPELEDVFVWLLRDNAAPAPAVPARDSAAARAPARAGAVIEATDLTRDFGRFRAVDRASFRVRAGEVFGLVGANGAGKTTVIKMLTGLLRPTAGVGQVAGVDMRRPGQEVKRRIGYMSQAFSLYQDLTAVENVRLYAGVYGLSGAEGRRRTEWALALGGLHGLEDTPTGRLPMGMRQRLALGCALVHRPEAVFLDEPTSGVDPIGRRGFWDILFTLAREEGVAILVTTHYMTEAERCDRLALMFAGRIVADASPAELKRVVEAEAGQLLEVTTDSADRARATLAAAGFAAAAPYGRHVRLLSHHPEADRGRVRAALVAAGIGVGAIDRRPLTMEEVFVHRVTMLERAEARPT